MKPTIDIITLGCSKNLVDSEYLMGQLEAAGYVVHHDPDTPQADIVVVNTCGFIADAQEESINTILSLGQRKNEGQLKKLFVMGCLSQRFMKDLQAEIPEVDKFYGKFDWNHLIQDLSEDNKKSETSNPTVCGQLVRHLTTPAHYAYIKISEGCNRTCSYCAIPIITGHHQSRPMEDILAEVKALVARGVKEFQIIAQELTFYGLDLYHERRIAQLVEAIAQTPGVEWVRLHYAYPADFPQDLLRVMREYPNVCKYLDVALQHISTPVLNNMRRHVTKEDTYAFVEMLRREVPGIHLRTTLMVGHPGEDENAFNDLMDFVRWARFERMGAFAYSPEMGTYSAEQLTDDIPDELKQERLSRVMRLQQRISSEIQEKKVGSDMKVIIDRIEGDYYVGRTEFDSPEVDPEVLINMKKNPQLTIGDFYLCHILSADDFDLYAEVVKKL